MSSSLLKNYLKSIYGISLEGLVYIELNLNVDSELEINLELKRQIFFLDYSIHIEKYLW